MVVVVVVEVVFFPPLLSTYGDIVVLHMKNMKEPSALCCSNDLMSAGTVVEVVDEDSKMIQLRVSGAERPKLFCHGTGSVAGLGIWQTRRMQPGSVLPIGVYGFGFGDKWSENAARFYDAGFVFVMEFHGALIDMSKNKTWNNLYGKQIPPGCIGFLRKGDSGWQYCCSPDGVKIVQTRVRLDVLVQALSEELDECGYSQQYHDALTFLREKYSASADARQTAGSMNQQQQNQQRQSGASSSAAVSTDAPAASDPGGSRGA